MPLNTTMQNFYDVLPSKYHGESIEYPNFPQIQIKLPCNMVVAGATGSGKTNFLMNFITGTNAFTRFYLYAKALDEPFYAYFIDKIRKLEDDMKIKLLYCSNDLADLPPVTALDRKENSLFICDDMVTDKSKNLAQVSEYFIRGRKENCSSIFISQSYYKTPKLMRDNSKIIVLAKIARQRDLVFILKEFQLDVTEEDALKLYKYATMGGFPNVFLLDPDNNDPNLRFRRNFVGINVNQILGRKGQEDGEEVEPPKKKVRYPKPQPLIFPHIYL
jgi:hypothetical protein